MLSGQKHLVKCRCVLQQYKKLKDPPNHQFVVFSIIDSDVVKHKHAQCTNCGVIHRVTEISRSDIVAKEAMSTIVTIDDIKQSIPQRLADLLEVNKCDLPSWELAQFILENKRWGEFVVLTTERDGNTTQGKYVSILSETMFKVETFTREEVLS